MTKFTNPIPHYRTPDRQSEARHASYTDLLVALALLAVAVLTFWLIFLRPMEAGYAAESRDLAAKEQALAECHALVDP